MNSPRLRIEIAVFAFLLGISTTPQVSAQRPLMLYHRPMSKPILHHVTKLPSNQPQITNPRAHSIALQRYAFVQRLEAKFGLSLLGSFDVQHHTVLFPVGRSDRIYLCLEDFDEESVTGDTLVSALYCYQRKNGKDQFVYRVPLRLLKSLRYQKKPIRSLLDFINDYNGNGSYAIRGKISPLAMTDLAIKRDYVYYKFDVNSGFLFVWLLSEITNDYDPLDGHDYESDIDPVTHAPLKESEFFQKYGLPVAKGELAGK